MIQESLSRLIRNKTVMIIAHRMRTVADSDKIVVSRTRRSRAGSPAELSRKNGIYQHMMETQMQAAGGNYRKFILIFLPENHTRTVRTLRLRV